MERGGIAAIAYSSTISDCVNYANISAVSSGDFSAGCYAGGIVGLLDGDNTLANLRNYGNITSGISAGGIAGHAYGKTTMTSLVNYAKVSGDLVAGGLIGSTVIGESNMYDSVNLGNVCTTVSQWAGYETYTGGLVGGAAYGETSIYFEHCVNLANVSGIDYAGGLCGYIDYSEFNACVSFGDVSGNVAAGILAYAPDESNVYGGSIVGGLIQGVELSGGFLGEACNSMVYECVWYVDSYENWCGRIIGGGTNCDEFDNNIYVEGVDES